MKAERRQELRTNDLAEQIEQVRTYIREHGVKIAATVIGIVVIVAATIWYTRGRENRVLEGWRSFANVGELSDPGARVDRLNEIAEQRIAAGLTQAAWLAVGETARSQILNPPQNTDPTAPAVDRDWADAARTAYDNVLREFPDHLAAQGESMIALGVLAEDAPDAAKARQWYQRILDNPRFEDTPFASQAEYRLEGLDKWVEPVVFAPSPVSPFVPVSPFAPASPFSPVPPPPIQPTKTEQAPEIPYDYPDRIAERMTEANLAPSAAPPTAPTGGSGAINPGGAAGSSDAGEPAPSGDPPTTPPASPKS